jgi:hypothetical protein
MALVMLCWSCAIYFSAAPSSENDHGSMNLNTAPLVSTTSWSVAAIHLIAGGLTFRSTSMLACPVFRIRGQSLRARQKLVSKLPITGELLLGTLLERNGPTVSTSARRSKRLRRPHTMLGAPFIEPHRQIAANVALKNVALAVAVQILVPTIDHKVNTFPRPAYGACASLIKRSPHYRLLRTLPPKRHEDKLTPQ